MNDILWAVAISGLFFLIGIGTQIITTLLIDKTNHKRNLERLRREHDYEVRYMQKETFFKKKLEYFETASKEIEKEIIFYGIFLKRIKEIKDIKEFLKILKKEKPKPILMGSSPLYSDSLKPTAIELVKFMGAQNEFGGILKLVDYIKIGTIENYSIQLEEIYKRMMNAGNEAIKEMRKELLSDY